MSQTRGIDTISWLQTSYCSNQARDARGLASFFTVPAPGFYMLLFTVTYFPTNSPPPHQDCLGSRVRNNAAEKIDIIDNKASDGDEGEEEGLCYENSAPAFLRTRDAICARRVP
ncbi:hypothetical protein TEQG_06281 [Trichophyton equinum CBS 127.97]|uniref:Uncharacterized protein n=1 Tax=Trichophyton equinum (strain ATCC MYA-4606 / CBS 127.97) TaxID=559882 RepID=F2PZ90_TRIEC|nr:hypothetical protein TEQG_06281 [Trichophyton equinum CBS 127.97]